MNDKQIRETLRHADPSDAPAPGRERVWKRITAQMGEDAGQETFTVTQTRSRDWMHGLTVAAALALAAGCTAAGVFLLHRPETVKPGEGQAVLETMEETVPEETTVPAFDTMWETTAVPVEETTALPVEEELDEQIPTTETVIEAETQTNPAGVCGTPGETVTETDYPLQWNGPMEQAESVPTPYFGASVWVDLTAEFTGDETFYLFDGQGTVTLCKAYDGKSETLRYELRDRGKTEFPDLLLYRDGAQEPEVLGMAVTDFTVIELYPEDGETVTLHSVCAYDPSMHFYSNEALEQAAAAHFNYFIGDSVEKVTAVTAPDDPAQVILYVEYRNFDPETYTVGRFTAKGEELDLTMEPVQ